ncbi:DUF2218 domain-containing protein [uncultured Roseibium sp.]|uniref:DUF2218 domain-containing protein n=1 Tax=uncultured Roseibium sp. TaxID=1936171 RepID=UPI003216F641
MYIVETTAKTASASKYLQQLCKHFAHKVPATFTPKAGEVEFPFGHCTMTADDGQLSIRCKTQNPDNVPVLKGVIDSHLERFAWREELKLQWQQNELAPETSTGQAEG